MPISLKFDQHITIRKRWSRIGSHYLIRCALESVNMTKMNPQ